MKRPTVSDRPVGDPMSAANVPSLLHPWDEEAVDIATQWFEEKVNGNHFQPPTYVGVVNAAGVVEMRPAHPDQYGFQCQLAYALGSVSTTFQKHVTRQLLNAPGVAKADAIEALNAGIAFIAAQRPQNEIETLTLVSLWLSQNFSATQMAAAGRTDGVLQLEAQGGLAVKAGNLVIRNIETLIKLRSAGKQVIEVQHVHVYPGGNAVVGTVNTGGGEPGKLGRPQDPISGISVLAALEDGRGSALSCPDTTRNAVPVSGDTKPEAVLPPRRSERVRRSKG